MGRVVLAAKITHVPSLLISEQPWPLQLFGLLGWDSFKGDAEQLCDYFPSSGSGQVSVEFHL